MTGKLVLPRVPPPLALLPEEVDDDGKISGGCDALAVEVIVDGGSGTGAGEQSGEEMDDEDGRAGGGCEKLFCDWRSRGEGSVGAKPATDIPAAAGRDDDDDVDDDTEHDNEGPVVVESEGKGAAAGDRILAWPSGGGATLWIMEMEYEPLEFGTGEKETVRGVSTIPPSARCGAGGRGGPSLETTFVSFCLTTMAASGGVLSSVSFISFMAAVFKPFGAAVVGGGIELVCAAAPRTASSVDAFLESEDGDASSERDVDMWCRLASSTPAKHGGRGPSGFLAGPADGEQGVFWRVLSRSPSTGTASNTPCWGGGGGGGSCEGSTEQSEERNDTEQVEDEDEELNENACGSESGGGASGNTPEEDPSQLPAPPSPGSEGNRSLGCGESEPPPTAPEGATRVVVGPFMGGVLVDVLCGVVRIGSLEEGGGGCGSKSGGGSNEGNEREGEQGGGGRGGSEE